MRPNFAHFFAQIYCLLFLWFPIIQFSDEKKHLVVGDSKNKWINNILKIDKLIEDRDAAK